LLKRHAPVEEGYKAAEVQWSVDRATGAIVGKAFGRLRKLLQNGSSGERMVTAKIGELITILMPARHVLMIIADPYPLYLQPIYSALSAKAIRETPRIASNKREKDTPNHLWQLFKEDGKFQVGNQLLPPPVPQLELNVDQILLVDFSFL